MGILISLRAGRRVKCNLFISLTANAFRRQCAADFLQPSVRSAQGFVSLDALVLRSASRSQHLVNIICIEHVADPFILPLEIITFWYMITFERNF